MKTKTSILPSRLLSNTAGLHPAVNLARTRRENHPPSNPRPGRWLAGIGLLLALNRDSGLTVIVATHDTSLEPGFSRIIRLEDGKVVSNG